uniref:hypothetical protein n=1 Tax=Streptomyces spongiicola TaxID=1690221 RepID=UPI0013A5A625|nr:hypothetical protein [Streptomyces spongiicola]
MPEVDAELVRERPGLLLTSDKGFASKTFERSLSAQGITLLRTSRKKEILRPGEPMLKKVRHLIESVNDTLNGRLDLEQHGGRTVEGVAVRVAQQMPALAAAIWHNFQAGQAVSRSLTADGRRRPLTVFGKTRLETVPRVTSDAEAGPHPPNRGRFTERTTTPRPSPPAPVRARLR